MTRPTQVPNREFDAWWEESRKGIQLRRDDWPHQVAAAAWNQALLLAAERLDARVEMLRELGDTVAAEWFVGAAADVRGMAVASTKGGAR